MDQLVNFFFVKSNFFFVIYLKKSINVHTHICNTYVHKYTWNGLKKLREARNTIGKNGRFFVTRKYFFSVAYGIRRYLEISD